MPVHASPPRSPSSPAATIRHSRRSVYLVALLVIGSLLTGLGTLGPDRAAEARSAATTAPQDPLFTTPKPSKTMAHDPWSDSLWIAADRAGLLQASTDGSQRTLWTIHDGLPTQASIESLLPTPSKVWIGTPTGLVAWDRADETFTRVLDIENETGTRMTDTVHLIEREGSDVWIGTETQGLFKLEDGAGPLVPVPNPENGSRFNDPILGLETDGPQVWISANGYGVVEWHRDTGESRRHADPLALTVEKPLVFDIEIRGDDVWIGTGGEGARKYNRTTEMWQAFANPDNLAAMYVEDLEIVGDEVWFAVETGVSRYSYGEDEWDNWNKHNGLPGWRAFQVEAGAGEVWASTREGVGVYERLPDTWSLTGFEGFEHAPPFNTITDCDADGDEMLVSTGGGGAARYDPATGQWATPYEMEYPEQGLPDAAIYASESTDEATWFASAKGVGRLDQDTGDWSYYRMDGWPPEQAVTKKDKVNDVAQGFGTVWMAGDRRGLGVYQSSNDSVQVYNESHGLSSNGVMGVGIGDEAVWVATDEGLDRFDPKTEEIQRVYPEADGSSDGSDDDEEEPKDMIIDVYKDGDHLWAATFLGGLVRVNPDTLETTRVPAVDKFASEVVRDGNTLWVAGTFGTLYELGLDGNGTWNGTAVEHDALVTEPRMKVLCMVQWGDVLHIGTTWGMHRYDTETGEWLQQQGLSVPASPNAGTGAAAGSSSGVSLEVDAPAPDASVTAGEPVTVEGRVVNASSPVRVEAKVGLGSWAATEPGGDGSFALDAPTDGSSRAGESIVRVRALDAETGEQLAATVVPVELLPGGPGDERVRPLHSPPLDAYTEEPIPLSVRVLAADGEGVDGATVTMTWSETGGQAGGDEASEHEVTLDQAAGGQDGRYRATLDAFESPTEVSYSFEVELPGEDGATMRLPRPGSPFGEAYKLVLRDNPGFVSLFAPSEPEQILVQAGNHTAVDLPIQNAGTRGSSANLNLTGPAASWIDLKSSTVDLERLSTDKVQAIVSVPADVEDGTYEAGLEIVPEVNPSARVTYPIEVVVGDVAADADGTLTETDDGASTSSADDGSDSALSIPTPGWPPLVITLAGAALLIAKRERRGGGGGPTNVNGRGPGGHAGDDTGGT